jgi:hypothetical protein
MNNEEDEFKRTGGPAYPTSNYNAIAPMSTGYSEGMTLRDYFAAKVLEVTLTALWAQGHHETPIPELASKFAYEVADAMLKARKT